MTDTSSEPAAFTLVTLTALLLRRWKIMLASGFVVFLAFAVYGFFGVDNKISYTTLYQVAEHNSHTPLTPIADTQQRVERVYARQARETLGLEFGVATASPRNSLILSMSTTAAPGEGESVRAFHDHIINIMEAADRQRLDKMTVPLTQVPQEGVNNIEGLIAHHIQEPRMGERLIMATAGDTPRRQQPLVWLVLGTLLGVISAVVSASLASFGVSVASALKESR